MKMPPEDPVRLVECLKSLGMTKYEALVYIALLRVPSATASEIHEGSSVPRASVYPVSTSCWIRTSSLFPSRLPSGLLPSPRRCDHPAVGRIERDAESAKSALLAIHRKRIATEQGSEELIWNLYGLDTIRRKLVDLIAGATHEIRIIAHPNILSGEVRDTLTAMGDRVTIEVVTPSWDGRLRRI